MSKCGLLGLCHSDTLNINQLINKCKISTKPKRSPKLQVKNQGCKKPRAQTSGKLTNISGGMFSPALSTFGFAQGVPNLENNAVMGSMMGAVNTQPPGMENIITSNGAYFDSRDDPQNFPQVKKTTTNTPPSVTKAVPAHVYDSPNLGRNLMEIISENSSLRNKKLKEWSLIGTHNSMTGNGEFMEYGGIAKPWAKNQILRFDQQMWSGVRHFDIRPIYMGQGIFQFHHGGWTIADYTLDNMVSDVSTFLHHNPNEIIQLSMSHFRVHPNCASSPGCDVENSADAIVTFMEAAEHKLRHILLDKDDIDKTYNEIITNSQTKRVAMIYNTGDHDDPADLGHSYYRWKEIERDAMRKADDGDRYASWYDFAIKGNRYHYAESPHHEGEGFNPEITNHVKVKKFVVEKINNLHDTYTDAQVLVQAFQMRENILDYFSAAVPIYMRFSSTKNAEILNMIAKKAKKPAIVVLDLWNLDHLGYYLGIIKTRWKK